MMSTLYFLCKDDTLDPPSGACVCVCVCVCLEGISHSYLITLEPKRKYHEMTSWDRICLKQNRIWQSGPGVSGFLSLAP